MDDEANMDSLIAHVEFDLETGSYMSSNKNGVVEIEATIDPFYPRPDPRNPEDIPGNQTTRLKIFPISEATISQGEPKHLYCMGLKESNLIRSKKLLWICSMLDRSRISLVQTGSVDGSFCPVSSQ